MANSRGSTIDRLASRVEKPGLNRRQMPGGGEVYSGELASRSLKAVNARAMTVDRSIIVSDDFDPNKPEDQALYAHEQFHLENSGGVGANSGHDHEEASARAVESMVLHRARTGGHEMPAAAHTAEPGGAPTGAAGAVHERAGSTESHGEAAAGYAALRAKGLSHHEIVEKLAREALMAMEHGAASRAMRYGDKKSFT